jgi:hypothetical protein
LLSYRAAKDKILKMSIYDNNSGKDIQDAITRFFDFSGTAAAASWGFIPSPEIEIESDRSESDSFRPS